MTINNNLLTTVPVWQGFSGKNRLNFHSIRVRRTRERLPSDGFIEHAPNPLFPSNLLVKRASDKALTLSQHSELWEEVRRILTVCL